MGAPLRVAVIDDDIAVGTAIGALLTSRGYHTEVYASADELIERAPQSEAACLVVDVQLGNKQVSSLAATSHRSVTRSP